MKPHFVVLISANAEWQVTRQYYSNAVVDYSPFGDWFSVSHNEQSRPIIIMHGGWGKVAAASSTQYAIDTWHPNLLVNLGTCGGFENEIEIGQIILAERTIIYDIFEQMGDPEEHINFYSVELDNSWLREPLPLKVLRTLLISGDRDLLSTDIRSLKLKYGAVAGDWESGSIAWVANINQTKCLILRGVTDLVGEGGGQAYNGNIGIYHENTQQIMSRLLKSLPAWLLRYTSNFPDDIRKENTQE